MNYDVLHQMMDKMLMALSDNNIVPTQSEEGSDSLHVVMACLRFFY